MRVVGRVWVDLIQIISPSFLIFLIKEPVYAGDGWPYNGDTINVIVYNSYNLSFIPTDKTCDILDYHGVFRNEINIEYQNLKRRYDGRVYAIAPHFVSGSKLQQGYIIKCGSVEDQGVKWRDVRK